MKNILFCLLFSTISLFGQGKRNTHVTIKDDQFFINGKPTYEGRFWKGNKIEGLLFNSRMVQGIFDDLNPETVSNFVYLDTKKWDANRNTAEFVSKMRDWYSFGLLAVTLNLQGGSPLGYGNNGWVNSAYYPNGNLRKAYMDRLQKILDEADRLGMVIILSYFYFGQDQLLENEKAIIKATDNITNWLKKKKYTHVIVELNNECDINYDHEILKCNRIGELIKRVKNKSGFLVSTSFSGGALPSENVVENIDFVLLHGNGVSDPKKIKSLVEETRKIKTYRNMPILFNEDDHFDFSKEDNNFINSIKAYASWGYLDYRMKGEGFEEGYQSVPVDWGINSSRKKSFFSLLKSICY